MKRKDGARALRDNSEGACGSSRRRGIDLSTRPSNYRGRPLFSRGWRLNCMLVGKTKRPRNVDSPRAAAILYGDWGTSKAYVIGLAFAIAGYSSFWLIAAMCLLTALVGVNYMTICRHYPDGGGVYASVRHRSEILSIVGAFLLIADYIVTAAIRALSAFPYLGWPSPEIFAAGTILLIGAVNY